MSNNKRSIIETLVDPFQRFFRIEVFGSILLLIATAMALLWANSRWGNYYFQLWENDLLFKIKDFTISKSFIHWINDGLMAIFFFVIGLEIKREIMVGELSTFKSGALPIIAALGGMIIPALIYLYINKDINTESGWGIPMATDVAFSLGVLGLLGRRVPVGMKVLLLAFAIVDDLGAVAVITLFYSTDIDLNFLIIGLGLYFVLILFNQLKVRNYHIYIIVGFIIWYMFSRSGIHPTIAGVLVAFTIPLRRKIRIPVFKHRMNKNLQEFSGKAGHYKITLNKAQLAAIDNMEDEIENVQSPLQFLEYKLHGFVAYIIMPLFAFANAGVIIYATGVQDIFSSLSFNIELSLVFGKLAGIFLFSWIGIKLGIANLPENTGWVNLIGLGLLGGMGFTMALFISNLAFSDTGLINHAKIGIIVASLVSGVLGYLVLRFSLNKQNASIPVYTEN
jgi:NhaA family Na+:H+ antiporter